MPESQQQMRRRFGGCKPLLTWGCFSAETQPSPSESIEPEREELSSVSKEAPMQVNSLELGKW